MGSLSRGIQPKKTCAPARLSKASAEMGAPHCKRAARDGSGAGSWDGAQMRSTPPSHAVASTPPLAEKLQHVTGASWPCTPGHTAYVVYPTLGSASRFPPGGGLQAEVIEHIPFRAPGLWRVTSQ